MDRWTTVGLVAVFAACQSGGNNASRIALDQSRHVRHDREVRSARSPQRTSHDVANTVQRTVSTTSDSQPTLVTVLGRAPSFPTNTSMGGAESGGPPAGGYVVRSTARPGVGASTATVPLAAPAPTVAEGGAVSGAVSTESVRPAARASASSGGGRLPREARIGSRGESALGSIDTAGVASPHHPVRGGAVEGATATLGMAGSEPAGVSVVVPLQQYQLPAGLLTAASVADVDRWENYLGYLARHPYEREQLGLDMSRRLRVRVIDAHEHPVLAAQLTFTGNGLNFTGQTHADGWYDFFPSVVAPGFAGSMVVRAQVESVGAEATVMVPPQGDVQGPLVIRLPTVVVPPPPSLDLAFLIDVTGSMGDELRYVNREIANIVQRVQADVSGARVRVGATFYRDRVDDLVVQQIPFTGNVPGFAAVMQNVVASGGGDYPEDLNAGLEAAMNRMAWSDGPAVRVLVIIADAPPQMYPDEQYTYHHAMRDAARRGIRILPVAASGADRTVEYLFRAMGVFTSTPYVYLTDESGIGNPHMEADTDRVAVERFNDLLVRLIVSDLRGQGMHEPIPPEV